MNAKKKILISISALLVVVLAIIGVVIAVLAAKNVTINGQVNITFNAANVYGSVTAKSKVGSAESSIGTASFNGDEVDSYTLGSGTHSVTLTSSNDSVEFIFTLVNTNKLAGYTATITAPDLNKFDKTVSKSGDFTELSTPNDYSFVVNAATVSANSQVSYVVKYTLNDKTESINQNITFSWYLESLDY